MPRFMPDGIGHRDKADVKKSSSGSVADAQFVIAEEEPGKGDRHERQGMDNPFHYPETICVF